MREKQAARHWQILLSLSSLRVGATVEELADTIGCTERTVYRDLSALEEAGWPIFSYKDDGKTRYRFVEDYRIKLQVNFSPMDLMALNLAAQAFNFLDGTTFHDALLSARQKILNSMHSQHKGKVAPLEGNVAVSFRPERSYSSQKALIDDILKALIEKRAIKIWRFTAGAPSLACREIEPYKLWHFNGALYVIAYCLQDKKVRTFLLDRIHEWALTDKNYEVPEDFDLEKYVSKAFKVVHGEEEHHIVIRVHPSLKPQMTELNWHPSQKIEELDDGWLRVHFNLSSLGEIKAWILSYAPYIMAEKPAKLVKEIARDLENSIRYYR